ncbi:SDR family NAD(P)-dependent oxidoreductase [Bacillus alkalicellulosilyticus]|uniref:SDR family NAD(P)-dependent oxidoreductase n=1 Tax=Alkalihalobacterium alkalicellulosilyticum TaxID=1912214 RepID=UPI0009978C8A|nr:SDR family NAD(P)-dependent oxidoreductase [Bacillus alkalicellulosilyticus]
MKSVEKVAIVTGSTKGIGYCIAKQLASQGLGVIVNGRDSQRVKQVTSELQSVGGSVWGLAMPVELQETGKALVHLALEKFGQVDILINNAGIIQDAMSYHMTETQFTEVIDVHVKGAFYCTKPFINAVKEQNSGGHIINMTSLAGLEGTIGQINYSAAKSALIGMTWTLAKELKVDNIQVNAISPAALTDMTRPYLEKAKQKAAENDLPLPSYWDIGSPDDVADFVLKLLKEIKLERTGDIYGVNGSTIVKWQPPQAQPLSIEEY